MGGVSVGGCPLPPRCVPAPSVPQEILNYISRKELEPLLKVDQLNLEKEKHKVFLRFGETRRSRGGVVRGGGGGVLHYRGSPDTPPRCRCR